MIRLFAPKELVPAGELNIVHRGDAMLGAKILGRGMSWGEDIILSSSKLRVKNSARAIGFLEVQQLSREKLLRCIKDYPKDGAKIRGQAIWMALRREMVRLAKEMRRAGFHPDDDHGHSSEHKASVREGLIRQRRKSVLAAEKLAKGARPEAGQIVEADTQELVTSMLYLLFEMRDQQAEERKKNQRMRRELAQLRRQLGGSSSTHGGDSEPSDASDSEDRGPAAGKRPMGTPEPKQASVAFTLPDDVQPTRGRTAAPEIEPELSELTNGKPAPVTDPRALNL